LHFIDKHPTGVKNCKDYPLSKFINKYNKNDIDIYKKVKHGETNAIKYAKTNLDNWNKSMKKDLNSWTSSTSVYKLIEEIRYIKDRYQ